jgi:hypothetical protein
MQDLTSGTSQIYTLPTGTYQLKVRMVGGGGGGAGSGSAGGNGGTGITIVEAYLYNRRLK